MIESPKIGIFEYFTKEEIEKIHSATLEVLEKVGVKIEEENALKLLDSVGADVDFTKKIAKIPPHIVKEAIKNSPNSVLFAGRDSKFDLKLEGKRVHFGLGEGAIEYLDSESNSIRPSTMSDAENASKLADALPNIDFVMPLFTAQDVPKQVMPLYDLYAALTNTEKPVMVVDFGLDANYLIKLASIIVGGEQELKKKPLLGVYSEPVSPLTHGKEHTRNLMTFAKAELPIVYIPSAASCSTAPATMAGAIVQSNAETLSGNVIAQFTKKGARFIYGADTSLMDQRTGVFSYGAPEWMIVNLAMAQLGRYYNLPIWSTGGCSDSKILDGQATLEAALSLFIAASSGANLIHDVGSYLNFGLTGSLELVTICDEIASMITYLLKGIEVNDDTLALDVISKVGPGGHFLTQKHTIDYLRKEHWIPSLLDRQMRESWVKNGSKDLLERAREKTKEILSNHNPNPLSKDIEKELQNNLKDIEKEILK
ncbi:MAG: trimethylamine methyltransferase family protein [Candidatus Bathyarchaeota archaeon]|nr:trimethylamine methyltransferase family protein [Candidatus Bathyarchaeota archaeon]